MEASVKLCSHYEEMIFTPFYRGIAVISGIWGQASR